MLIKLHGIFAKDFGPEYEIEADTMADAIEGLTRQLGFYGDRPLDLRPQVRVAEVEDLAELFAPTEQKVINLVPAMIGGGGVAKIVLGAAIIVGAILAPWSLPVTTALVSFGATLVLNGAMQLFMKAPTIDNSNSADPEASKYMSLGDNTVAIGTPIAIQYGRGPATGHLLAVNVDSSDMVFGNFPATP